MLDTHLPIHACYDLNFTAEVCKKKIDIGVLMDGTISVRWKNFKIMRQFVGDVTKGFKIGQDFAVFGIMQFGRNGMMEFRFDETEYWDSTKLEKRIKEIKFARGMSSYSSSFLKSRKIRSLQEEISAAN